MVFNEEIMIPFVDGSLQDQWGWCIVHCPEYCESEFEIAELQNGTFIAQSNGEEINQYVKAYIEIESYL